MLNLLPHSENPPLYPYYFQMINLNISKFQNKDIFLFKHAINYSSNINLWIWLKLLNTNSFVLFLRKGLAVWFRVALNSLYGPNKPQTGKDLPTSGSQELRLQECATTPGTNVLTRCFSMIRLHFPGDSQTSFQQPQAMNRQFSVVWNYLLAFH